MAKIVDPDSLSALVGDAAVRNGTNEVVFDTSGRLIYLDAGVGNLIAQDGVTLQALYSFCKEEWKDNANLIKLPFPFEAITEAKFDVINGWNFADAETVQSIRDAGWSVLDTNGNATEQYFGFITLGTMDDPNADRAYYQQEVGGTATSTVFTGPVNEAVQILDDPDGDGAGAAALSDFRSVFNAFLREQGKTYASSSLGEQGILAIDYTVYRLPLANAVDPKITETDANIATIAPYTSMSISYLNGTGFTTVSDTTYAIDDVVQEDNGAGSRWFRCTTAGTVTGSTGVAQATWGGTAVFEAYPGERQIGTEWYAFNVLVAGADALAELIYEFTQYSNRQATDINSGLEGGTVNGNTAAQLLFFLGDTLITGDGVYIDNFNANDTNRIEFNDVSGTTRLFPFVAAGTITFNANLQNDADARYWMFFSDPDGTPSSGDEYGTSGAIVVNDDGATAISGLISANPSISWTFDYDGNNQGGRTPGTDANVVIVAIGLNTAQFVSIEQTIERSVGQNFSLVSNLERNYSNPA